MYKGLSTTPTIFSVLFFKYSVSSPSVSSGSISRLSPIFFPVSSKKLFSTTHSSIFSGIFPSTKTGWFTSSTHKIFETISLSFVLINPSLLYVPYTFSTFSILDNASISLSVNPSVDMTSISYTF